MQRSYGKRYSRDLEKFPHFIKKMFEQMQNRAELPAFQSSFKRVEREKQFKKPDQWTVQVGDRVLITKGKYKGTISKVLALQSETNRVFLEHSETKKIVVPKQFWQPGQTSHIIDYPLPAHPFDLKVVGTVVNEDGSEKTIAADKLVFKGEYFDDDYKKMMPYRRIRFNENIIIPWPRPDPVEDCEYSTSKTLAEERTFMPTSLVYSDSPVDLLTSLRNPLIKRPYKWDTKYFTKSEVKRLTPPKMPMSESKKAGIKERVQIKNSLPTEPSKEIINMVGDKVATFLNQIDDPHFAKFINKMSPDYKDPKQIFQDQQKKLRDARIEESRELNKIKAKVQLKYKLKKSSKNGSKVF